MWARPNWALRADVGNQIIDVVGGLQWVNGGELHILPRAAESCRRCSHPRRVWRGRKHGPLAASGTGMVEDAAGTKAVWLACLRMAGPGRRPVAPFFCYESTTSAAASAHADRPQALTSSASPSAAICCSSARSAASRLRPHAASSAGRGPTVGPPRRPRIGCAAVPARLTFLTATGGSAHLRSA